MAMAENAFIAFLDRSKWVARHHPLPVIHMFSAVFYTLAYYRPVSVL